MVSTQLEADAVNSGRVVVWHDANRSQKWIVTLEDGATVVEHEFVRDSQDVAIQAAKTLGGAIGRPLF